MSMCNGTSVGPLNDATLYNPTIKAGITLDTATQLALAAQLCNVLAPCIADVYYDLFAQDCATFTINNLEVNHELKLSPTVLQKLALQLLPLIQPHILAALDGVTLSGLTLHNPVLNNATLDGTTLRTIYDYISRDPQLTSLGVKLTPIILEALLPKLNKQTLTEMELDRPVVTGGTGTGVTHTLSSFTNSTFANNTFTGAITIIDPQAKQSMCDAIEDCVAEWISDAISVQNGTSAGLQDKINKLTEDNIALNGALACLIARVDKLERCENWGVPLIDCTGKTVVAGFAVASCASVAALAKKVESLT